MTDTTQTAAPADTPVETTGLQAVADSLDARIAAAVKEKQAPAGDTAPAPDPLRRSASEASEKAGDTPAKDAADAPEGDTPEAAGDEDSQAPADEGEAPSVEPPAGWNADDQAWFKALPLDRQERIAKRERDARANESRRHNEHAEAVRATEAERTAISTERQRYADYLSQLVTALTAQTADDFSDIKTNADLRNLAHTDPGRYAVWQANRDTIQQAEAERRRVAEQNLADRKVAFDSARADEHAKLAKDFPAEFGTPEKAAKTYGDIGAYLLKAGFPVERIKTVHEASIIGMVRKAMAWDRAQAKAAAATTAAVKPAPKVVKPGAGHETGETADNIAALAQRAHRTGSVEDMGRLLDAKMASKLRIPKRA